MNKYLKIIIVVTIVILILYGVTQVYEYNTPAYNDEVILSDMGDVKYYPKVMTIPASNYCDVNSDCTYEPSCRTVQCWNKDNLPEPYIHPPNMGICPIPQDVVECACEKNRCQPISDDGIISMNYRQPCESGMNCFSDELCLDHNLISWQGVALKRYDVDSKQCHLQCDSDSDCPGGFCISAKLVSEKISEEMSGVRPTWENHPLIVDATDVKFCWGYLP